MMLLLHQEYFNLGPQLKAVMHIQKYHDTACKLGCVKNHIGGIISYLRSVNVVYPNFR